MTKDEIRAGVLRILCQIAPEADPAQLMPDVSLREQLDIDSMDFLNFVIGLHKEFDVDIPEADYAKLRTIDGCVNYVLAAAGIQGGPAVDAP
jgi:acyl carrier protein